MRCDVFLQTRCAIAALPVELLSRIFGFLKGTDLLECANVCSLWLQSILHSEQLWLDVVLREFPRSIPPQYHFHTAEAARRHYLSTKHGLRSERPHSRRRLPVRKDLSLYASA